MKKRAATGRFAKGNAGGPGRPRKKPGGTPPAHEPDVATADELHLAAAIAADLDAAWSRIIGKFSERVCRDLIEQAQRRGTHVPSWVLAKFPAHTEDRK